MDNLTSLQQQICRKFGSHYVASDDYLKVGISRDFDAHAFPINGLRHPPEGDTTGWYIWSGLKFSEDPRFFVPLHVAHLNEQCPSIVKYLALAPGWRFLIAPDHEDVWYDAKLLNI